MDGDLIARLFVVLGVLTLMGALTAAAVWWIRKNRELWRRRDFKALMKRRRDLWQATSLMIAGVLLAVALFLAAYVSGGGGILR